MQEVKEHIATPALSNAEGKLIPQLRFKEFDGEWVNSKLGEGIKLISGQHMSPDQYNKEGIGTPYFTGPSDFTDREDEITKWTNDSNHFGELNDILFTVKGSGVGTMTLLRLSKVAMGRQLMAIRSGKYDSEFVYHFLLKKTNLFVALASGNMIPGLSRQDILTLKHLVPKLPEQQKIASFLSAVDEKIQHLTKKKVLLEQYKKGVMQQLFSGQLRFKDENGNPYPDWEEIGLGSICSFKNGKPNEPNVIENGDYKLITLDSVSIKGVLKTTHKTVNINDHSLSKGDLVMVLSDIAHAKLLGLCDLIPKDDTYVLNQRMGRIRFIKDDPEFMGYFIRKNQNFFRARGQGTSQKHIYERDVNELPVNRPCIEEQQKIATYLSSIDTKIDCVNNQITQTQTFKKGLLQQLFV